LEWEEDSAAAQEDAEQTVRPLESAGQEVEEPVNVEMPIDERMLSPDWEPYINNHENDIHDTTVFDPSNDENLPWESRLAKKSTLEEHLVWQLRLSKLTERQKRIGAHIVGNLDENGYLTLALEDICKATESAPDEIETVLKRIQSFDPVGIAARDMRECLLVQLENLQLADSLAARIVAHCLAHLGSKRYDKIARELDATVDEVTAAIRVITSLEPRPSSGYEQEHIERVMPDVFVEKNGDGYLIRLNDEAVPRLRVSPLYQRLASEGGEAEKEARQYLKEKVLKAKWLIDAIAQRQATLRAVTESIFKFQRQFLDHGIEHLRPMMMREVADDIKRHESTVSRATANKWVDTPQGVFKLRWFFQTPITTSDGDIANATVKAKIRDLISKEDRQNPYSDQYIATALSNNSITIARRTVAKYREDMRILPSSKRRQPDFRKKEMTLGI